MIRALKREGIPVAGADRMQLMRAASRCMDLLALADVLLMPEDDLSLAVVLKSPLFGLDDDDLFDLAYGRNRSLWDGTEAQGRGRSALHRSGETLSRAGSRAPTFTPPYEFFLEVLGEEGERMRKRMLTRLGPEAAEALDEFLDLALAYDREAAALAAGLRQPGFASTTSRSSATWSSSATRSAS